MSPTNAVAFSVGVLAGLAVLVTDVVNVPTWLVFLAWLTYFFCGLGTRGLKLQLSSNLWGIGVGIVALAVLTQTNNRWLIAGVVAIAAFTIAQSARFDLLSQTPGSFVGFVMIAASLRVTGESIGSASTTGPIFVAVASALLGSVFAVSSEALASLLTKAEQEPSQPDVDAEVGSRPTPRQ